MWVLVLALLGPGADPGGGGSTGVAGAPASSKTDPLTVAGPAPDPETDPDPDPTPEPETDPVTETETETETEPEPETDAELAPPGTFRRTEPPPARPPGGGFDPDNGVAPGGGYWVPGERPESAPADGKDERIAGYILLPIGTLTMISGAVMTHLSMPSRCPESFEPLGINADEDQCRALLILNGIRTGYGAAAMITGATLIAIGHHRKKKLEEWKRRRFRAGVHGFERNGDWAFGGHVGWRF